MIWHGGCDLRNRFNRNEFFHLRFAPIGATSNIFCSVFPALAVLSAFDEFVGGIVIERHEFFLIPFDGQAGSDCEGPEQAELG